MRILERDSLPVDRWSLVLVALQSYKTSITSLYLGGICSMASNASMSHLNTEVIFLRCTMNYLSDIWILFTFRPWNRLLICSFHNKYQYRSGLYFCKGTVNLLEKKHIHKYTFISVYTWLTTPWYFFMDKE